MEPQAIWRNQLLFLVAILVILGSALTTYFLFIKTASNYQPGQSEQIDRLVKRAQAIYRDKKGKGEDLKNGPCLSNELAPGWVADLVHNPRAKVDDLPSNQCQSFLEGKARHFVELDLDGNVVRVQ